MKNQPQKCTATKPPRGVAGALLFAALLMAGNPAWAAQVAGMVARLSGPLMVKKADGSVKVLALRSEVESGDTLISEKNTYAQIKFVDNSEITLRPGTTFKVENFAYDEGKPEGDDASYSLVKGGLRSITGLMGKRNKEKFLLKTPNATIGIRGTTFVAQYVPAPGPASPKTPVGGPPAAPVMAPGLYVQVSDGAIVVSNAGGSLGFQAGQFGFVPNPSRPPVLVPSNPGLIFTPPPAFNVNPGGPLASQGPEGRPDTVDCIVR
ncbi:FecR family protein [Massilia yuzhufengensis]|uniref:FecR family protein n=1 Tax=Massilia yuzhufengensis TaxID=1164594 RepID=A0A1I1NF56_9BURK|nr:FecR family protein [Massilia yuzhufengensis]SFC96115.1 FecR family protein [Massilia yuzhufengensis]